MKDFYQTQLLNCKQFTLTTSFQGVGDTSLNYNSYKITPSADCYWGFSSVLSSSSDKLIANNTYTIVNNSASNLIMSSVTGVATAYVEYHQSVLDKDQLWIKVFDYDLTTGTLPADFTFTRSSTASFVNAQGIVTSAAINIPRIDYHPTTGVCKGILIEQAQANYMTYSSNFSLGINQYNSTITTSYSTSPDNLQLSNLFNRDSASNSFGFKTSPTFSAATTLCGSIFAKGSGLVGLRVYSGILSTGTDYFTAVFNLSTLGITTTANGSASGTTAQIIPFKNGWNRLLINGVVPSSTTAALAFTSTDNTFDSSSTNVQNEFWAAQLSRSTQANYIPTVASSVTRAADTLSLTTLPTNFLATEGTIFANANVNILQRSTGNAGALLVDDGTGNNYVRLGFANSGNTKAITLRTGNVQRINSTFSPAGQIDVTQKLACAYGNNVFCAEADGQDAVLTTGFGITSPFTRVTFDSASQSIRAERLAYFMKLQTQDQMKEKTR
jgi:hypothetical protein